MKKKLLLLLSLFTFLILVACSNDDSSEDNDILTGTAWYHKVTDDTTVSYSFSPNKECHYMFQTEGKEPILIYYKYRIIDNNKIEIYKDNKGVSFTGEFNEETLTITSKGTGETETYKRNKYGSKGI